MGLPALARSRFSRAEPSARAFGTAEAFAGSMTEVRPGCALLKRRKSGPDSDCGAPGLCLRRTIAALGVEMVFQADFTANPDPVVNSRETSFVCTGCRRGKTEIQSANIVRQKL